MTAGTGRGRGAPPTVSAVIPAYNAAAYVRDAIDSVLAQDAAVLECLVVDDGSRDSTADVVRGYAAPVQLIQQENAGVSAARNAGIAAARGDVVAFLDADDTWEPAKISTQLTLLTPGVGLVYTGWRLATDDLRPYGPTVWVDPEEAVRRTLLLEPPVVWVSSTALVPRVLLEQVGGFDAHLSTSADTDLAVRIGLRHRLAGAPRPLVRYRQHEGQMHLDAVAMEHDMRHIHEKVFQAADTPGELVELEGRAKANLNTTLAMAYAKQRHLVRAGVRLGQAMRHDPRRTLSNLRGWRRQRREASDD